MGRAERHAESLEASPARTPPSAARVESAAWWRARARAIVHCTLEGFEGQTFFAARLRRELRQDFARHARTNAPVHTRRIWRQVVARACACKGIRTISDNRMRQLPLFEEGRAA